VYHQRQLVPVIDKPLHSSMAHWPVSLLEIYQLTLYHTRIKH